MAREESEVVDRRGDEGILDGGGPLLEDLAQVPVGRQDTQGEMAGCLGQGQVRNEDATSFLGELDAEVGGQEGSFRGPR